MKNIGPLISKKLLSVFLCSFSFYCGAQRIINYQSNALTCNLYIACPVGEGLWSLRALLNSVLNKTLTPYLGSNATLNYFRVTNLPRNLAEDTVWIKSYTNSHSDSAADKFQSVKQIRQTATI